MDIDPVQRRVASLSNGVIMLFRSAFFPREYPNLRWYDRIIRGLGVVILAGALIYILYGALTGQLSPGLP